MAWGQGVLGILIHAGHVRASPVLVILTVVKPDSA